MKALGELSPDDVSSVAQIERAEVRMLWSDDYYDGPLSGIAEWKGHRYRFEMTDRSTLGGEEDTRRKYWMIALTKDQLQEEEYWQDLFCSHVWTGFDFTSRHEYRTPSTEHGKFYEPYAARKKPDYTKNVVVGWFELQ